MKIGWVALACTACASAGAGGRTARVPVPVVPHADIAGLWQYDPEASTTPGALAVGGAQADSGRRGRGGRGLGGRGFGGTDDGFRGRGEGERGGEEMPGLPVSDKDRRRTRQAMRLATDAGSVLRILQTDSTVVLVRPQASDSTLLRANGLKTTKQPPKGAEGDGAVATSSVWASGEFFVTRAVDGGGKVTEIYYRQPDDPRLYVVVRVEGGPMRRKIEFRRVFNPVKAPGS